MKNNQLQQTPHLNTPTNAAIEELQHQIQRTTRTLEDFKLTIKEAELDAKKCNIKIKEAKLNLAKHKLEERRLEELQPKANTQKAAPILKITSLKAVQKLTQALKEQEEQGGQQVKILGKHKAINTQESKEDNQQLQLPKKRDLKKAIKQKDFKQQESQKTLNQEFLELAAKTNITEVEIIQLKTMLDHPNVNIDFQHETSGQTALMVATNEEIIYALLNHETKKPNLYLTSAADSRNKNDANYTAMHLAIYQKNPVKIEKLINNGYQDSKKHITKEGHTGLSLACKLENYPAIKLLLKIPVNPTYLNHVTNNKQTALTLLIQNHPSDSLQKAAIEQLIEKGASIGTVDNAESPLIVAASCGNESAALYLIEQDKKIHVNEQFKGQGKTALMFAVTKNLKKLLEELLAHKETDITIQDDNGFNVLHHAVKANNINITKILIPHKKIDILSTNNNGDTALAIAVEKGYLPIVKELLQYTKTEINSKNNKKETILSRALDKATRSPDPKDMADAAKKLQISKEIAQLLLQHNPTITNEKQIKQAISLTCDDIIQKSQKEPIAEDKWKNLDKYLCTYRYTEDMASPYVINDNALKAALIIAIQHDKTDVAKNLIKIGAPLNANTTSNKTPLMWAASLGNESLVVDILAKIVPMADNCKNAIINQQDNVKATALIWAATYPNKDIAKSICNILENAGATREIKDKDGKTYEYYLKNTPFAQERQMSGVEPNICNPLAEEEGEQIYEQQDERQAAGLQAELQ